MRNKKARAYSRSGVFLFILGAVAAAPSIFIAGTEDKNEFRGFARVEIIANATHRVPWDQPQNFTYKDNQFIEERT